MQHWRFKDVTLVNLKYKNSYHLRTVHELQTEIIRIVTTRTAEISTITRRIRKFPEVSDRLLCEDIYLSALPSVRTGKQTIFIPESGRWTNQSPCLLGL